MGEPGYGYRQGGFRTPPFINYNISDRSGYL